ncbi:MAG: OmpA family protein [Actinobacteria bacterium]|nr:OmpA family protein [Actinomycetota bacterium]
MTVLGLGGCERATVEETAPPAPDLPARTQFEIREGEVRTEVSIQSEQTRSQVEVRVQQILTDLQAEDSPEGTVITLPERVLFDFDRADLKAEAAARIDQVAEVVRFYRDARITIRGHTDSVGADAYNQTLSERRAEAVRRDLVERHSIPAARLVAVGFGERFPVAPNTNPDGSDNPAGREQNRRVEIVVEGVHR